MVRVTALTSPLLLGFDDLERALDKVSKAGTDGYPPYNIERIAAKAPNRRSCASRSRCWFLAGPDRSHGRGEPAHDPRRQQEDKTREYLHRGIAARQFQRSFLLADGMQVLSAELAQGLLSVDLVRPSPSGWCEQSKSRRANEMRLSGGLKRRRVRSKAMRSEMSKAAVTAAPNMTPQEFAHLGDGSLAYVKTIASEDVADSSRRRRRCVRD